MSVVGTIDIGGLSGDTFIDGLRIHLPMERIEFETGFTRSEIEDSLVRLSEAGMISQIGSDEYEFGSANHEVFHKAFMDLPMEDAIVAASLLDLLRLRTDKVPIRTLDDNAAKAFDAALPPTAGMRAALPGSRPLIDKLHEATFSDSVGMQWVADKYALRNIVRKAHCFTIDAHTSALVADFSLAIAKDLDTVRRMAIPPFPTTWFQIDNKARLAQAKSRGIKLTSTAEREDVIGEVGWLITTIAPGEYCASYACELAEGMMVPPLSYHWSTREPTVQDTHDARAIDQVDRLVFGVNSSGVDPHDAWLAPAPWQRRLKGHKFGDGEGYAYITQNEMGLMTEIAGELRHIFGLLVALGAGHLGAEIKMSSQAKPRGPMREAKGKPLFPIEHKVLTINLAKKRTVEKIIALAITGAKKRWHEVRSHWRELHNPDGSVRKRVPVKAHARGDERLGKIEKTYKVEANKV